MVIDALVESEAKQLSAGDGGQAEHAVATDRAPAGSGAPQGSAAGDGGGRRDDAGESAGQKDQEAAATAIQSAYRGKRACEGANAVKAAQAGGAKATHYSLELATTEPNGTSLPWKELWCGAAHAAPDFSKMVAQRSATRPGGSGRVEAERRAATDDELFSYSLDIEPTLFGKLRLRCWVEGESLPSLYSNELMLPRYKGKISGMNAVEQAVRNARASYFEGLTQHVTDGGVPQKHRLGNTPSANVWGGDAMPPPPAPPDSGPAKGVVMARVPYDVPQLVRNQPGFEEAGAALARLWRGMGVLGGGGGTLCDLRIDHIMHAVLGTPTTHGAVSPCRTIATVRQPLMAFCEVLHADVLLPLLDTVAVVKDQWEAVDARVAGIVAQIALWKQHYHACEAHLIGMVSTLQELYEMMRQCQPGQAFTFQLTHPDLSSAVKSDLEEELTQRIDHTIWKLSTELLEMQLQARTPLSASELAAAMRLGRAAARSLRNRKKRRRWAVAAAAGVLLENPREDAIVRAWRPSLLGKPPSKQAAELGQQEPQPPTAVPCPPAGGEGTSPAPPMPSAWTTYSTPAAPTRPRRGHLAVMSVCNEAAAIAARKAREALVGGQASDHDRSVEAPATAPAATPNQVHILQTNMNPQHHTEREVAFLDCSQASGSSLTPGWYYDTSTPPTPWQPAWHPISDRGVIGQLETLGTATKSNSGDTIAFTPTVGKSAQYAIGQHSYEVAVVDQARDVRNRELDVRRDVASDARPSASRLSVHASASIGTTREEGAPLAYAGVRKAQLTPALPSSPIRETSTEMDLGDGGDANGQRAAEGRPASHQLPSERLPLAEAPFPWRPQSALGSEAQGRLQPLAPGVGTLSPRAEQQLAEWPPRGQRSPPPGARSLTQLRTSRRTPRMLSGNRWRPEAGQAATWTSPYSPSSSPRAHWHRFPDRFSSQRHVEPYTRITSESASLARSGGALSAPPPTQAGASFAFASPFAVATRAVSPGRNSRPSSSLVLTNPHSPHHYSFAGEPLPQAMVSARLRGRQGSSAPLLHPSARTWHQMEAQPPKRVAAGAQQSRDVLALDIPLTRPRTSGAMQHQQVGGAWLVDDLMIF